MLKKLIIHSLLPILGGGLLYFFFGDPSIRLLKWIGTGGYFHDWMQARGYLSWLAYNLPDGLWAYSLTSFFLITRPDLFGGNKVWTLTFSLGICTIYEILQRTDVISGTGDLLDILFYMIFGIIAYLRLGSSILNNEKVNP